MIRIERYIEKLLLTYDCVIIPDLGGFVAQHEPAYRVEENGAFYPPYRTIGFNGQLTMNDGLLAQAYMQSYDTNYPEALRLVKKECSRIKNALHDDGYYNFENIGKLELNADGKLVFTPESEGGIVAPQLYGLDILRISPFVVEENIAEEPAETTEETAAAQAGNLVEAEDELTDETQTETSHYVIRLNRTLTHYVAAAVVAICFYFAFAIPVNEKSDTTEMTANMTQSALYNFPFKAFDTTLPAEIPTSAETALDTAITSADIEIVAQTDSIAGETISNEETKQPDVEPSDTPYYTIVLASCIKERNAKAFVEELSQKGYGEAKYFVKNKMQRVIYSHYATEAEATAALRKLNANDAFSDAWVLYIQ